MYCVILAAGKSKRIGKDKAFLKIGKETFISTISGKLKKFAKIIIVSNKNNFEKIKKELSGLTIIINKKYHLGQIYSVKLAIRYLIKNKINTPLMIHLIDQPLIRKSTYKKLISQYKKNTNKIIIPYTLNNDKKRKRGHPIIIPQLYFPLVLKAPYDIGLHWVTHHKEVRIKNVYVNDKNIIKDIDTIDDYRNMILYNYSYGYK